MVAFILPANSASSGYDIDNSVRISGSRFLQLAHGADGTTKTMTFSWWFKQSQITTNRNFFGHSSVDDAIFIRSDDGFSFIMRNAADGIITTNRKFRDNSAWYHIVLAIDTTQGTAANRIKLYVNGVQETSFATATYPDQNTDLTGFNTDTNNQYIGREKGGNHISGYMADINFIDGAAKAPTDFGEVNDNGVWVPIKYSGGYGTNGYFLEFNQTGTSQNASGIGADTSGNDAHWAIDSFTARDIVTDSPTNNFATLNPLAGNSQLEANGYFFGNTRVSSNVTGVDDTNYLMSISSIGVTTGKWYAEFQATGNLYSSGTDSTSLIGVGSGIYKAGNGNHNTAIGGFTHWWLDHDDDRVIVDGDIGNVNMNDSTHVVQNDTIGVYLNCDLTMPKVTFLKNGAALGGATNSPYNVRRTGSYSLGDNNPIFFMPVVRYGDGSNNGQFKCNFGNPPDIPSSGNADANGFGNFEYSPTLGGVNYFALCTKNLAEFGG